MARSLVVKSVTVMVTVAVLAILAILAVLLAVFWLYTRPDFMVNLANQVWGCF